MISQQIKNVKLIDGTAMYKRECNTKYLFELKTENLLLPYLEEAGLAGWLNYKLSDCHFGWDSPLSQIRGAVCGHWLSAAARTYDETQNIQLKAKADYIVSEIARCQEVNGGGWAFSIPEKYLQKLKMGQHFWAPHYVCHKTMMGLLDMYLYAGNGQALKIINGCADWFYNFTNDVTRANMDMMMDIEETGGIMELWADLYAVTNNPKHLELMKRYERPKLTDPLLEGEDVLTNMHANTTVPEIHGCARAYEVTGEEKYREMVETYWNLAVTERGTFATGGQTCGEVWTAKEKQSARLGPLNQEHCVVFNMIRLANYLFKWTGDSKYQDYIELNRENGLFAQGYCGHETHDTVAYYLPLAAGSSKAWGHKTEDFWCCHCTLLQANATHREYIYYKTDNELIISQFLPSKLQTEFNKTNISVEQNFEEYGHCIEIREVSKAVPSKPKYSQINYKISTESEVEFTLKIRKPWHVNGEIQLYINGEKAKFSQDGGYISITRIWKNDEIQLKMPRNLHCIPLADRPNTVAFMDGATVLAGLVENERILYGDVKDATTMIEDHNERQWTNWTGTYKTINQQFGFYLVPLQNIINEKYTVYFPVKNN